jgi:hypothetical protein
MTFAAFHFRFHEGYSAQRPAHWLLGAFWGITHNFVLIE